MSSSPQSNRNRSVTNPEGRLAAGAMLVVIVVASILGWKDLSLHGRGLVILGAIIGALNYYQIGWKRMVLEDDALLIQDRLRRVRRIPYGAIWRITWVDRTVFALDTDSYGAVSFDRRTANLADFTTELAARVLRERESVVLSGDLHVEQD